MLSAVPTELSVFLSIFPTVKLAIRIQEVHTMAMRALSMASDGGVLGHSGPVSPDDSFHST